MTNYQAYKTAHIEAQQFRNGWTAVVYWTADNQSVAVVGAPSEDQALQQARLTIDRCISI